MAGWNNELLQIGPVTIYGYGLMIAIGVLVAYAVGEYRAKKQGLSEEDIDKVCYKNVLRVFKANFR